MIWIFLHLDFVIQKKYGFLNGGWVGCRGVRRPMLVCTLCKDLSGKLGVFFQGKQFRPGCGNAGTPTDRIYGVS